MRILNNASSLFFMNGYRMSDVAVFNAVDAATGAPSMPATGAPQAVPDEGGTSSLDNATNVVQDIMLAISALGQRNAEAAKQQQTVLESAIKKFTDDLESIKQSTESRSISDRQNSSEPAAESAAGFPAGDIGMAGGTDLGLGAGAGMGGMPPVEGQAAPAPMPPMAPAPAPVPAGGETPLPPAGASVQGMMNYDDISQLNQTGVTGPGGSTMPQQ